VTRTVVVFSPVYYRHDPGRGHPESARRLHAIINELNSTEFVASGKVQYVQPMRADIEDAKLVHDIEYIKHIESFCISGGGLLDLGDTVASPETYRVALHAVGGILRAVDLVMDGKFQNAFALVRPPGHHAGRFTACGFCIFNNVAIAAQYLLRKFKLKKILILDVDAHHGNGTQEIFYDTSKILYISLHEDPRGFPGTGFIDEIGEGEGLGYKVNIPLPFKTGDQIYEEAMEDVVTPIVNQYRPQFILVSAGFDSHYTDPVGSLALSASCHQKTYDTIIKLASKNSNGRLVSVLEGGYSLRFVGKLATAMIATMSGERFFVKDDVPRTRQQVARQSRRIMREVKKAQSAYWNLS